MENLNEKQLLVKQSVVRVGDVDIPVVNDGEEVWHPISYIMKNILYKSTSANTLIEYGLGKYMKKHLIDYWVVDGGIQEVNCINIEGLKLMMGKSNLGRLKVNQRIGMNNLLKYLDMGLINIEEKFLENLSNNDINNLTKNYSEYVIECINVVLNNEPNIKWQKCSKCNSYFPYHSNFFSENRSSSGLNVICKECGLGGQRIGVRQSKRGSVNSNEDYLRRTYNQYGNDVYLIYKNHDTIAIYEHWKTIDLNKLPDIIDNKDDQLIIIKYYYDLGFITKDNLSIKLLEDNYAFQKFSSKSECGLKEVYIYLFGEEHWQYPWRYSLIKLPELSFSECKMIFDNYLLEFDIKINDIYTFAYSEILKKAKLDRIVNNVLSFIVEYYDCKYPGYKFKCTGKNYYKDKKYRDLDMMYYIEQDKKIPIEKISLYVTKMAMQRNARALYNVLHSKKYYNNLFEWIDECYPNKFIVDDFEINSYRDAFDSEEEMVINEILHKEFKNITYNQRNTQRTITINGMIPDWFIHTDNNCWIIEHFGFYNENKDSTRSVDYKNKIDKKLEAYSKMKGYKFVCFYPKDLKDNCKGIYEKIKVIS
jgi:RNase P subunit RPR2